jgi:hypothetical protein
LRARLRVKIFPKKMGRLKITNLRLFINTYFLKIKNRDAS